MALIFYLYHFVQFIEPSYALFIILIIWLKDLALLFRLELKFMLTLRSY